MYRKRSIGLCSSSHAVLITHGLQLIQQRPQECMILPKAGSCTPGYFLCICFGATYIPVMALPYDILYIHTWKHVIRLCMYLHHISIFQDPFATYLMIDNLDPFTTYIFLFYSLNIYTVRTVKRLDPFLLFATWGKTRPGGLSKCVCLLTCIGNTHFCVSVLHTVCFMRFMREGGS